MPPQAERTVARIALWGKGFRVTQDSEEFQRLVPRKWPQPPSLLESHIDTFDGWPGLLQPLYSASERDVSLMRCALIRNREIMCCSLAKTDDRHKRPSILAVSACAPVDWEGDVASIISRTQTLTSRLAAAYATSLKGNPDVVGLQLKGGTFVQDNAFELGNEASTDDWSDIIRAVKEWNGITGVASPRLAGLGANIVIGTKHEAGMTQSRLGIDGYYDVSDRHIHPLTERLARWRPETVPAPISSTLEVPPQNAPPRGEDLRSINENLANINVTLGRMATSMFELMDRMTDLFVGDPKRKKK